MSIFEFIEKNNLLEVKKYLQFGDINIVNEKNRTLLHYAVYYNSIDCINLLIDNYVDLNKRDYKGQSPIFEAAIKGKLGILKLLVQNGADINIQDNLGNIPLFYGIRSNNTAVVDLLSLNANLSLRNIKEEDALLISIKFNYHNINKFITDNINIINYQADTILHYACKYNNINLIQNYINRYLINKKNKFNESVFFYAVKYSNRDIVRILLDFLPCIDVVNIYGETLLEVSKTNHYKIDDLIENYQSTLDYIYYKNNNKHIYQYLCNKEFDENIKKNLLNKKDSFSLSLVDYIKFDEDKELLKIITK